MATLPQPNPQLGRTLTEDVEEQLSGAVTQRELDAARAINRNSSSDAESELLEITVPPPEPGYNRAKVTVYTLGGKSNTIDFFYKNVCVPTPPPTPDYTPNIDPDIQDAYNDCLDNIDDLFCTPIPTGSQPLTLLSKTLTPSWNTNIILHNGESLSFSFDFTGYGNYLISVDLVEGDNNYPSVLSITRVTGSIASLETETVTGEAEIPLEIATDNDQNPAAVRITVQIVLSEEETASVVSDDLYTFQLQSIPEEPPERRVLSADKDLSDSNKELYIISSSVADININQNTLSQTPETGISEPIRKAGNYFWVKETEQKEKLIFSNTDGGIEALTSNLYYNDGFFFSEQITTENSESAQGLYLDAVYQHLKPYTPKEVERRNLAKNTLVIEAIPEYNFYYKKYEELIADRNMREAVIPNMYFHQLLDQKERDLGDRLRRDERLLEIDPKIKLQVNLPNQEQRTGADYYEHFVEKYPNTTAAQRKSLDDQTKNIVIPYSFLPKIEEFSKKDEIFPMHIDLRFDTNPDAGATTVEGIRVANLLKQNKIGERLLAEVANAFLAGEVQRTEFVKQEDSQGTEITINEQKHVDLLELLRGIEENSYEESFTLLGDIEKFRNDSNPSVELLNNRSEFITDIEDIVAKNLRRYKQIIGGKKCYKETLFYRIQKTRTGQNATITNARQNIWIPNDPDRKSLRYIDSQVKYDQNYTYIIYSYDLVIANEYSIGERSSEGTRNINNSAKLLLVENVYQVVRAKVKDRPPVAPEVSLYTYRGVDNKLIMLLDKGTATYRQNEVILSESDREFFDDVRLAQGLEDDEMIEFSGDDVVKKYQIYRTTTPPLSYEDFQNSLYIEKDTRANPNNNESYTNSTSYVDNIKPNVKYYYTFRCVDIHDQISNPGLVYEVEMINEHGTIFPLINVYDFPEEPERQKIRDIKRFLMIKPSALQGYMEINTDGTEDDYTNLLQDGKITFGLEDTRVMNKKYKLRIVSKNSNKVYDLSFSFTNEVKIKE